MSLCMQDFTLSSFLIITSSVKKKIYIPGKRNLGVKLNRAKRCLVVEIYWGIQVVNI